MKNLKLYKSESLLAAYFDKKVILVDNINGSTDTLSGRIWESLITPQFAVLKFSDNMIQKFYFPQKIPKSIGAIIDSPGCDQLDPRSGLYPKEILMTDGIIKLSHALPKYMNPDTVSDCTLNFWVNTINLRGGYW